MTEFIAYFVTDARADALPGVDAALIVTVRGAPEIPLNLPNLAGAQMIAALIHNETAARRRRRRTAQ